MRNDLGVHSNVGVMSEQKAAMDPVRGYEERLAALLQQCAEDFQARPDAFLWNCRRCLECVAYAQLSSQQQNYQPGSREGELSNFAGKLPRKLQDEWRFIVGKSNLAVHVTGPGLGDHSEDVRTCKEQLDKIVRWYFDPDGTRADKIPTGIADSLDQLRRGGIPRLDLHRELEAKQQEIEHHLQRQFQQEREVLLRQLRDFQEQGTRVSSLEASLREERARAKRLEQEILARDGELKDARERLAEREPPQNSTPTPPPAVIFAPGSQASPKKRIWVRRVLVAAGAAFALLFLFLGTRSGSDTSGRSAPAPSVAPVSSQVSPQVSETVVQQEPPSPPVPPSAVLSIGPRAPLQCPPDMIRIERTKHLVTLPTRSWAHNPTTRPGWVEAAPFCIDAKLVSISEYNGCKECSKHEVPRRPSKQPILSRTHEEASRFCHAMRGGRLPTVTEREIAARVRGLEIHNRTGEWSEEPFPAPVFQLGAVLEQCKEKPERCFMVFAPQVEHIPDGDTSALALDPGWNRELGSARRADIGFRCVFTGT